MSKTWQERRDELASEYVDVNSFVDGYNLGREDALQEADKLIDELRKVLPRKPSMDGTDSCTQCQLIVDRVIKEWKEMRGAE